MRKDAKEFRLKGKAPPLKSNSMRVPTTLEGSKSNKSNSLNINQLPDMQNGVPMFDYDKFQNDLKSDSNLQKVYLQFVQAYKNGNLAKPSSTFNKGKKKTHKGLSSNSYTQANTQEGQEINMDKMGNKNKMSKNVKDKLSTPEADRQSKKKSKVHSLNPSPQR